MVSMATKCVPLRTTSRYCCQFFCVICHVIWHLCHCNFHVSLNIAQHFPSLRSIPLSTYMGSWAARLRVNPVRAAFTFTWTPWSCAVYTEAVLSYPLFCCHFSHLMYYTFWLLFTTLVCFHYLHVPLWVSDCQTLSFNCPIHLTTFVR